MMMPVRYTNNRKLMNQAKPENLRLHFKITNPAHDFIIKTLPPYSIHCRCPFRVSEISSSFFPNLKIALLTFLCTSVNQTLTYIVLPLFLRQENVGRPDKKSPFIYLTYQKCARFILQISHCDRRSDICKNNF